MTRLYSVAYINMHNVDGEDVIITCHTGRMMYVAVIMSLL